MKSDENNYSTWNHMDMFYVLNDYFDVKQNMHLYKVYGSTWIKYIDPHGI